eukprot:4821794-Prymnesium_polylepis.1
MGIARAAAAASRGVAPCRRNVGASRSDALSLRRVRAALVACGSDGSASGEPSAGDGTATIWVSRTVQPWMIRLARFSVVCACAYRRNSVCVNGVRGCVCAHAGRGVASGTAIAVEIILRSSCWLFVLQKKPRGLLFARQW